MPVILVLYKTIMEPSSLLKPDANVNEPTTVLPPEELHESHVNRYELEGEYQKLFKDKKLDLDNLKEIDPKYHNEIAKLLIEKGEGDSVAENLSSFQGVDHNEIARLLVEKRYGRSVADNLSSFQGLNNATARLLVEK